MDLRISAPQGKKSTSLSKPSFFFTAGQKKSSFNCKLLRFAAAAGARFYILEYNCSNNSKNFSKTCYYQTSKPAQSQPVAKFTAIKLSLAKKFVENNLKFCTTRLVPCISDKRCCHFRMLLLITVLSNFSNRDNNRNMKF